MTATMPTRSYQQRRDALDWANVVRSARAAFKRVLRDAEPADARRRVVEMLMSEEPAPEFATMRVWDLLMAVPKLGRVKVNRMMIVARCSPSKTMAGLSWRQRQELAALLCPDAERVG